MDGGWTRGARAARLLAFTAFFTTLVIYSPNVMVLQGFDANAYTGNFAEPCLVVALLSAAALAALSLRGVPLSVGGRTVPCLLAGLYLVGNAGYALVTFLQPSFGAMLNTVCALCAGAGVVPACIAWARAFRDLDLCRAVLTVAFAGGVSALCNTALSTMPAPATATAYLALLLAGVAWPVADAARPPHPETREGSEVPERDARFADLDLASPASDSPGASVGDVPTNLDVRAFLSVMGVPLLGMAIASFAMGVQPATLFDGAVDAQHLGMLVGAVALLPLARLGRRRPVYSFAYQVYLPGFAALALVLCAFPADTWMRDVALAAVYAFYAMVCGVAIAAAVAIANAREFPRGFVLATLVGAFCGMGMLGVFLGARVGSLVDNNAVVLVVLTALYGGWLLFSGCLKSWRLMVDPPDTDAPSSETQPVETFDDRVARLAAATGLSPRETQIVGYVGRGHSSVYVAKALLISESTVYSHVRNIYRKLGLSSREELIQLLNGADASGGEGT